MERLTKRAEKGAAIYKNPTPEPKGWEANRHAVLEKCCIYEELEEQGLLQRIECHCKDCVHWSDMVAGATEHVKLCTVGGYMVGENGYCVFAEQALKQME